MAPNPVAPTASNARSDLACSSKDESDAKQENVSQDQKSISSDDTFFSQVQKTFTDTASKFLPDFQLSESTKKAVMDSVMLSNPVTASSVIIRKNIEMTESLANSLSDDGASGVAKRALLQANEGSKLVQTFEHATKHSAIQAPIDGLTQLANWGLNQGGLPNLPKLQIIEELPETEFNTPHWYAQTLGIGTGMVIGFLATQGVGTAATAVGRAGQIAQVGNAVIGAERLAQVAKIGEAAMKVPALKAGLTGFAYGALTMPASDVEAPDFIQQRLKNGAVTAVSGAMVRAGGNALSNAATSALPAVNPALIRPVANSVAGYATGVANAEVNSVWDGNGITFDPERLHKEGLTWAVMGVGSEAAGAAMGRMRPAEKPSDGIKVRYTVINETRSPINGPLELPPPVRETGASATPRGQLALPAPEGQRALPAPRAQLALPAPHEQPALPSSEGQLALPAPRRQLALPAPQYEPPKPNGLAAPMVFTGPIEIFPYPTKPSALVPPTKTGPGEVPKLLALKSGAASIEQQFGSIVDIAPYKAESKIVEAAKTKEGATEKLVSAKTLAAQIEKYPTSAEFKELIGERAVGELPIQFRETGLSSERVVEKLDGLASMLRSLDGSLPSPKKSGLGATEIGVAPFEIKFGSKDVRVEKVGIGEVAHVYKLSIDGQGYAFKVPTDPHRLDVHGAYAETGAYTYLSKYKLNDLIDFHAAHPSKGWLLTEYVDHPVIREGQPIAEVLKKENLKLGDDWFANRGPGDVVWDVGGIVPIHEPKPTTLAEFQALLATPEGRMVATRNLQHMKRQEDLFQALSLSLEYPELTGQVARSAKYLKDEVALDGILYKALMTPGAAGRAGFDLDLLAGTQSMTELFHLGLENHEARIELAKQIDKLRPEDRKAAFDAVFEYPEARPMAARAIRSLSEFDQMDAIDTAKLDPGSRYVLLKTHPHLFLPQERAQLLHESLREHLGSFGLELTTDNALATITNSPSLMPKAKALVDEQALKKTVDDPYATWDTPYSTGLEPAQKYIFSPYKHEQMLDHNFLDFGSPEVAKPLKKDLAETTDAAPLMSAEELLARTKRIHENITSSEISASHFDKFLAKYDGADKRLAQSIVSASMSNVRDFSLIDKARALHAQVKAYVKDGGLAFDMSELYVADPGSAGSFAAYLVRKANKEHSQIFPIDSMASHEARSNSAVLFFDDPASLSAEQLAKLKEYAGGRKIVVPDLFGFGKTINAIDLGMEDGYIQKKLDGLVQSAKRIQAEHPHWYPEQVTHELFEGAQDRALALLGPNAAIVRPKLQTEFVHKPITPEAVADFVAQYPPELQSELITMLDQIDYKTFGRMAEHMRALEVMLEQNALERGIDPGKEPKPLFVVGAEGYGDGASSDALMNYIYKTVNHVPKEQFVSSSKLMEMLEKGELTYIDEHGQKRNRRVVFLDDTIYSGNQVSNVDHDLAKIPDLTFMTLGAYSEWEQNYLKRDPEAMPDGTQKARTVLPVTTHIPLSPFKDPVWNARPPAERAARNRLLAGEIGFGELAAFQVYPYMTPDNDAGFIQKFARALMGINQ